jgi:threonine/homoserine/homoserine lactone efflux protein
MENGLTISSIAALFATMVVLAFIPSVSVLTVSARSAAGGFSHGVFTTLGIVVGDIVFIIIAIYGLSMLTRITGGYFFLIKYFGGIYLIWLGIQLWKAQPQSTSVDAGSDTSLFSSFLTGLLITLGDQKAVLFYLGFFPAYVDLSMITVFDTGIILSIAAVAVAGPKLVYAALANKASLVLKDAPAVKILSVVAGSVMIGVGILLIIGG